MGIKIKKDSTVDDDFFSRLLLRTKDRDEEENPKNGGLLYILKSRPDITSDIKRNNIEILLSNKF
jgi:hypothetical protein